MDISIVLVLLVLIALYITNSKRLGLGLLENFSPPQSPFFKATTTPDELIRDIQNLAEGVVGPMIGDVYLQLRNKNFDPISGIALPPMWVPTDGNDPRLNDPSLIQVRENVKAFIDNAKRHWSEIYPEHIIEKVQPKQNLSYSQLPNGKLVVQYLDNGVLSKYYV